MSCARLIPVRVPGDHPPRARLDKIPPAAAGARHVGLKYEDPPFAPAFRYSALAYAYRLLVFEGQQGDYVASVASHVHHVSLRCRP